MTSRIWILGASDPEMAAIEELLRECGEQFIFATVDGQRAHPGNAYRADAIRVQETTDGAGDVTVYLVESSCPLLGLQHDDHYVGTVVRIDHHRPGDPGFGAPPEAFLRSSSLGQVISELEKLSLLPWTDGVTPRALVLTAAADHCLGPAYAGRCPGVDPDEMMHWRVESRAKFQGRSADEILADIAAAEVALEYAGDVGLLPIYCECPKVADMRGMHVPELPEAGTRYGIAYVADCLPGPDGRRKVVCSGTAEVICAFLTSFVAREGLIDPYGDPARGFAGAYYPE